MLTLVVLIVLTVITIITFYILGMKSKTYKFELGNRSLNFKLSNCRLFIDPTGTASQTTMTVNYLLSIKNIVQNIFSTKPYSVYTEDSSKVELNVDHFDDIRGCNINLKVPVNVQLKSLDV